VSQNIGIFVSYALTSSSIDQFSNLFHHVRSPSSTPLTPTRRRCSHIPCLVQLLNLRLCDNRIVSSKFPGLMTDDHPVDFVKTFKYLGHIINNKEHDNDDIHREIKKNMYISTNILNCKFRKCSHEVKVRLFKTYCLCFYDIALWRSYTLTSMNHFRSCYDKCLKIFFRLQAARQPNESFTCYWFTHFWYCSAQRCHSIL